MLVFPVFELLLLACCTAGGSRALRSSHGRSVARAVSDNQLEVLGATTIPNYLPEEKLSLLTSKAPFLPVLEEDSSRTNMVITTVAPSPTTMAPTVQNSIKLNISLTTTFTTATYPQNITTTATTDLTTTTTITNTPNLTTKKGNFLPKLKLVFSEHCLYT